MKLIKEMISIPPRNEVPGTQIYTEVYTKSEKLGQRDVLLLMPGGPGNDHTVLDYKDTSFAESVLPYVDVILFDPRGCGNSKESKVEFCTLDHYIDDVEAIRKYYNLLPEQSILVGVSYGAIAALGYSIKYQAMFRKLILICGAVCGDFIQDAQKTLLKIGTPAQQEMGEQILTGNFAVTSGYYETMGPLYSCTFKPGLPTPNIKYNIELANFGFKKFLREFDYRSKLINVKSKTLILAGELDWIFDKKQSKMIHQGMSDSKLIIYDNCGHMIWIDQNIRFLEDVIKFIK